MDVTVYFATNRVVSDPADPDTGYQATMVAPSRPADMTYGVATVSGLDPITGEGGSITGLDHVQQGGFAPSVAARLSMPGRNLLLFIHGFANSFADAITKAATDAVWLRASQVPAADTTVIAFAWPSQGRAVGFPLLPEPYLADQHMAEKSGPHLMAFLATLAPIIAAAKQSRAGLKSLLLAHSMGNLALQSAVETWFLEGNGRDSIFDLAALAAGDCPCNCFTQPKLARLSGLDLLARRIAVYYSHADHVLQLSMVVNLGSQRLGQDGPLHRTDTATFPPGIFSSVDCSSYQDYDFNMLTSHQYYRESPAVRTLIAQSIGAHAGGPGFGAPGSGAPGSGATP